MTKYIELNGQTLEINLYYNLGGMNYFTGKTERRGYYLSVSPVHVTKLGDKIVSKEYVAFSGIKKCLLEAKRKSNKSYNQALEIAKTEEQSLIDYVTKGK